jgi:homotetrameric cytidine deaminase
VTTTGEEVGVSDRELVAAATAARGLAYAPYSGFRVGAALLTADGTVIPAGNVENASYGLTICAERVAACAALAGGQQRFLAIAVVTDRPDPVTPCGACRQFLREFPEGPALRVLCASASASGPGGGSPGPVLAVTLDQLLPRSFGPGQLQDPQDGGRAP